MSLAALWLAGSAAAYVPTLTAPPARPPVLTHALTADSPAVAAQQVRATRLVRPIVIDGVLHDLMWEGAERVTGFLQRDPNEGMAPTESTYRSEEHTSELQSPYDLVCRLLLEK